MSTNRPRWSPALMKQRIASAKKSAGIKNNRKFSEELEGSPYRPIERNGSGRAKTLSEDAVKKWGTNAIPSEWIPAICDVLKCDAGYLFGEHDTLRYELPKLQESLQLSSNAILVLSEKHRVSQKELEIVPSEYLTPGKLLYNYERYALDALLSAKEFPAFFETLKGCFNLINEAEQFAAFHSFANGSMPLGTPKEAFTMLMLSFAKGEAEAEASEADINNAKEKLRLAVMYAAGKLADEIMDKQIKKWKRRGHNG